MKIDTSKAKRAFARYSNQYDSSDEKVKLKIIHTYKVADIAKRIAKELKFSETDCDLAYILGILHDVGRFEQLRRFGTFNDAKSLDHAQCGADILFNEGKIRDYLKKSEEDKLLETAVRVHNAFAIPKDLDERTKTFCQIIRDADKIDILRVNVETPIEEIYQVTTDELKHAEITQEVMEEFAKHKTVLRSLKKTPVDNIIGHAALVFGMAYPISLRLVREQGFLKQLLDFESENQKTKEQFKELTQIMEEFLEN